jgi:sortase A
MRYIRRTRVVESVAWLVGCALLIAYAAAQWHFSRSYESGLEEFETARREVQLTDDEPPAQLQVSAPDMTAWSAGRIAAYESEDRSSAPRAVLRIPAIELEVPVYAGVTDANLNRGAAWIQQTAPLGKSGNTGIASHRDGYFRALRGIAIGDRIELQTMRGTQEYSVDDIRVVLPKDVHVLAPTDDERLTLVTCYPFYVVGPAPKRFIVSARAVRVPIVS